MELNQENLRATFLNNIFLCWSEEREELPNVDKREVWQDSVKTSSTEITIKYNMKDYNYVRQYQLINKGHPK